MVLIDEASQAQKTEEKLKFLQNDIKRHIGDMQSQAEKNRKELSQIYSYLRETILEREQALKKQISDNLIREELQQCSEVNGSKGKDLLFFSIQQDFINHLSLLEVKRDQELAQFSKIIHPNFKSNNQNGINGSNTYQQNNGSSLYSHTLSTANKLKKTSNDKGITQLQLALPGMQIIGNVANMMSQQQIQCNQKLIQKDQALSGQNSQVNIDYQKNSKDHIYKNDDNSTKIQSKQKGKQTKESSPNRNSRKITNDKDRKSHQNNSNNQMVVLDQKQSTQRKQQFIGYNNNQQSKSKIKQEDLVKQNLQYNNGQSNYNKITQQYPIHFEQQQDETQYDMLGCINDREQHIMLNGQVQNNLVNDDVSSIYPLDTNECCYFNYSPKSQEGLRTNNKMFNGNNDKQSSGFKASTQSKLQQKRLQNKKELNNSQTNLNDLLETLNKSQSQDIIMVQTLNLQQKLQAQNKEKSCDKFNLVTINEQHLLIQKRESSTTSETGGSTSDNGGLINVQQQQNKNSNIKSNVETPKEQQKQQQKMNQWKTKDQKQQSNQKQSCVENSKNCNYFGKSTFQKKTSIGDIVEKDQIKSMRTPNKQAIGDGNDYCMIIESARINKNSIDKNGQLIIKQEGQKMHQRSESLNRYQQLLSQKRSLSKENSTSNLKLNSKSNIEEQGYNCENNDVYQKLNTDNSIYLQNSADRNKLKKKRNSHQKSYSEIYQDGYINSQNILKQKQQSQLIKVIQNQPEQQNYLSPTRQGKNLQQQDEDRQQLMIMLQECSKSIEKLEFRPSAKKQIQSKVTNIQLGQSNSSIQSSPLKPNQQKKVTAICLVDLTKKDDEDPFDEEMDKDLPINSTPQQQKLDSSPTEESLQLRIKIIHSSHQKQNDKQLNKNLNTEQDTALIRDDELDECLESLQLKTVPNSLKIIENSPIKEQKTLTSVIQKNNTKNPLQSQRNQQNHEIDLQMIDNQTNKISHTINDNENVIEIDEENKHKQLYQYNNLCDYRNIQQDVNCIQLQDVITNQKSQELIQQLQLKTDNSQSGRNNTDNNFLESEQTVIKQQNRNNLNIPSQLNNISSLTGSVSVDTSVNDPFKALCRVKEEFIFVFSGFNDQKLFSCECFDVQRNVWKEITNIGKPRTKFAAVPISKSRILLFGGKQTDGQRTGEIEEYNLKTNKFKTLPFKMPKARSGFAACVKREEGKIFFCGGNSGSVLRKFDCLDLKKGKWSKLTEMIQKRDELAVAMGSDGKIYAIGGYGGQANTQNECNLQQKSNLTDQIAQENYQQSREELNNNQSCENQNKQQASNCLRTAERYDFTTGQWEMIPQMNEARRALAVVSLPDGIYAIGGYDGKQYLDSVEKFDIQKNQWISVKNMQKSRCTLAAVASIDFQYIYALGGFNGTSLDMVERYDIMSGQWELITPMNSKRFMHEAVSLITH